MKRQTVKINGHKLVLDMLNMDFLKRLIDAQEAAEAATAASAKKYLTAANDPRALYNRLEADVQAVCTFFDAVFGEGTADRVFSGCNEAAVYQQALLDFNAGLEKADKAICRRFR